MSASADAAFLDALRRHRLLDSTQLEELQRHLAGRTLDAKAIGKELIRRGWLTPFQVNQIIKGQADQLVLGHFVLLERLGEGGMGSVFKARNTRLGKVDAVKVIRKEKLAEESAALRFQREIQATARLSHPNIVGAHDAGQSGDALYFAMEYVEGTDLSRQVKEKGPLPVAQACEYIRQAACGLAHAHEKGLVHRDIKPSNLMVTYIAGTSPVGLVKILDLGLARLAHGGTEATPKQELTQDGQLVGTLDYLAPEQALDPRGVDIRADLYSLGCAFYFLLAGRAPFAGTAMIEKLAKHRWDHPVTIEKIRPDVPPEVAGIIRKLMAKKPADRYQTPKEVADVLAALMPRLGPLPASAAPLARPVQAAKPMAKPSRPPIPIAAPVRPPPGSAPGVQPASANPGSRSRSAPPGFALGIDLGTTYSVVAFLDSQGRPTSVHNQTGDFITPSVVLFDDAGIVVGREAVAAASLQPDRVAECAKRDMGSKAFRKKILGKEFPPEVISAFVLRSLKTDAVRKLGPVSQAVITVPAYFDENRRRATMDAGRLAGLDVLDIINEPTAAALAYGYQLGYLDRTLKLAHDKPLRVLVYDLGGGTFDVTIVEIHGNSFKAVATDGDVYLGGKDWDARLIEIAARRLQQESGVDPRKDPATMYDLANAVEAAKRTLSERSRAAVYVNHAAKRRKVELSREEFEEKTADLLMRTQNTADLVLRQAGLRWANIDKVLLVGGSTRMPAVERMLTELAGQPPDKSISPDEAVAHGAALYADLLIQRQQGGRGRSRFAMSNVSSHSLGIIIVDPKIHERRNEILIPRNTPLPCAATKTFRTQKPNQPKVIVRVVEGESERPEACAQVGVCTIDNLPPDLPQGAPVQVTYAYKENGQLDVTARLEGRSAVVSTYFLRENQLQATALHQWANYVAAEWHKRNE